MDRTRNAVERMLAALDAPAYDLGILSERGMLPGLSNLTAAGVFSGSPSSRPTMRAGRTSISGQRESTASPFSTT